MAKSSNILKKIGNIWIKISVAIIIFLYCLNLVVSDQPFTDRVLAFINIWNAFFMILIILPGYVMIVMSEKTGKEGKKNT